MLPCGRQAVTAAVTVAIQEPSSRARVERLRWLFGPTVLAAAVFWVAAMVWTFPIVLHLSDSLLLAPDELFQSWVIGWDAHALLTDPLHLYQGNIYFPFQI